MGKKVEDRDKATQTQTVSIHDNRPLSRGACSPAEVHVKAEEEEAAKCVSLTLAFSLSSMRENESACTCLGQAIMHAIMFSMQ